jgi:hypothetical protein
MTKFYASIIDQILDDVAPSYENTKEEKGNGDAIRSITKDKSDNLLSELGGKSHHTVVPSGIIANREDWRDQTSKSFDDGSVLASALKAASGESIDGLEKKMLSDKEIQSKIDAMLHLGWNPDRVGQNLNKIAELAVFNRGLAADYLNDRAGLVGLSYIEPNHFMKSSGSKGCIETFNKIKREGTLKAASVKKTSACDSCSHCAGNRCTLYRLPIVASNQELQTVVNQVTARVGKKASKQALVDIHNGAQEESNTMAPRVQSDYSIRSAGDKQVAEETVITATDFRKAIEAGKSFNEAFVEARSKAGTLKAKNAAKNYINELKKTGSKVNLDRIDCKYLTGKLASKNAIVGSKKCAGCTFRTGMHCGMTGGTLLTFPGLDRVNTNKNASENVEYDGNTLNSQVGLDTSVQQDFQVEIKEITRHDVDLGTFGVGEI